MASPEKRVRCPGEKCPRERCPALFSSEQFEFLLDENTELYDFKLFVALWEKEYVDESLKANPYYEVCPFCYYIEDFEGLPKHEHPLFKCKTENCGKASCRLCRSLAHEGKTCQEAKMPELAEDVEEQTRQLTRLLDEAMSEGRFMNCR
jgi:TRIAD3 protein (E3 ubiquitin-protein ligase RNF216)